MSNKYQKGKIYKIVDVGYNKCYVGFTCEELSQRMARHRCMFTQHSTKSKESYRSCNRLFEEFGVENCKIELIEEYPCNNQVELHRRERQQIQNNECVNKVIAGRTDKEYYDQNKEKERERKKQYYAEHPEIAKAYKEANKDRIAQYQKQYRENNKQQLNSKRNEKHNCDCGGRYTHNHKAEHFKSHRRQKYLKQLEEEK